MGVEQGSPFGALLRHYRKAAGLTQERLAERAYMSPFTVSALERGANQTPRPQTVDLLAQALGLGAPERAALEGAARAAQGVVEPDASTIQPPLIGRVREIELLERRLAGDGPPILLLAGEPGIGKTRLVQAAIRRAIAGGWRVLEGGCQRRGGQDPYAPLLNALQRHVRRQSPRQLRADLEGCAWLARLLPELAGGPIDPLPAWSLSSAQERRLMGDAVARLLANVAGPMGTLLALDDLQWAGPDALDLLATLARAAGEIPLRVVGAYRDTEAHEALSTVLADLAAAGLAERRRLGPLAPADAALLLDSLLEEAPEAMAAPRARVLERSGGVPFFVVSCVRALRADDPPVGDGGGEAVPWDVEHSIRQRVATLPAGARHLLGVAAVVGRVVPRPVLVAVVAQPSDATLDALDAACRAGLLEEEGPDAYRFAHDLVREVVEADLGAARRAVLHQRVAEALEARPGAPVETLAYHYAQSDVVDKAILYLERAGDHAATRGANSAAEGYYREMARLLERQGQWPEAAHAYEKLGLLLERIARYEEALEALQRAVALDGAPPATEPPETRLQSPTGAASRSQPGDHAPDHARETLYLAQATLLMHQDRLQECLIVTERLAALARDRDDIPLRGQALGLLGIALRFLGRLEEALAPLYEACRIYEDCDEAGRLCYALSDLVFVHALRGEFAQSLRCAERMRAIADAVGDPWMGGITLFCRAALLFDTGAWEQATADLAGAIKMAPHLARDAYVVCLRGIVAMAQGDWGAAAADLEGARGQAAGMGDLTAQVWAERSLAELDLLQGRPGAALERLRAVLERENRHDEAFMLPYVALAHLRLGAVAEAEDASAQALARARADGNRLALADALRAHAQVAMGRERWKEAESALEEGLALTRLIGYPYAEARLEQVYGRMRAEKGEPEQARSRLENALAIFRRLGARKDVEQVERAIAAL